jgi:hypothetical protein
MPDISLADLASPEVLARARKIKLFLMDVDGTLTDGGVCLISSPVTEGPGAVGVSEIKVFNAKDGQGLSLAHTMGIQTGFITGRRSPAVAKRAEELIGYVCLSGAGEKDAGVRGMRREGWRQQRRSGLHGRRFAGYTAGATRWSGNFRSRWSSRVKSGLPVYNSATGWPGCRARSDRTDFEGAGALGRRRTAGLSFRKPSGTAIPRRACNGMDGSGSSGSVHRLEPGIRISARIAHQDTHRAWRLL